MPRQTTRKKRADGNYSRQITTGRKADGKPIRKTIYAKTLKELDAKAAEFERKLRRGELSSDEKITFGELAAVWARDYTPNASERTKSGYQSIITNHLIGISGYMVKDLKKHDLQSILNALSAAGCSRSLMAKVKLVAVAVIELAIENDIAGRNVFTKATVPDAEPKTRQPLTDEQKAIVLRTWEDHRMGLPALLMLYCGLRRGELLALTWRDVDLKNQLVHVSKSVHYVKNAAAVKPPKSKAGNRVIPIPNALAAILRNCKRSSLLVCPAVESGGLMSDTAYKKAWQSYMHYLNLAAGGKDKSRSNPKVIAIEPFTAHQLRHTYATVLYDAGVDMLTAQRLLGHADLQVTLRIYTHLSETREQTSIDALNLHIGESLF